MIPAIDPRFLSLIVHDLRNPLNVIGLSVRMIEDTIPHGDGELEEDFGILRENLNQIEHMLNCLSDFCRQGDPATPSHACAFSTERLMTDLIDEYRFRHPSQRVPITLNMTPDSPPEATLDPTRARQAILHALANTVAAAGSYPVRITSKGSADRWVIEITTDAPAGDAVRSAVLRPDVFERLSGNSTERRGLELAIAAQISDEFGGSARLEVDDSRGTKIVLDWPVHPNGA